ncbi:hypothetical protein AB0J86_09850 [Micromonospora sp. NPDC049559]|uniref:hypothetical protein n=1 Tax=Micromonospora sp. NPDC049559 TaxID=3155923 RepID=UPI00341686A4
MARIGPQEGPNGSRFSRLGTRHTPSRPLWICRVDAAPWPCAEARLWLTRTHRENPVALYVLLGAALAEAMTDLYRLDAYGAPEPRILFDRFLGWTPARRPT